jgi:hypothetical protein
MALVQSRDMLTEINQLGSYQPLAQLVSLLV